MSSPAPTVAKTAASLRSAPQVDTRPRELNTLRATTLEKIEEREKKLIHERRATVDAVRAEATGQPRNYDADPIVGLALSGGGVRSATFNLGVLQALAEHRTLRAVDYLSTVSGGGYIGAFLGRFYTRFINRPKGAVDVIEARLSDATSPEISWLRRCSEYMAVSAGIEATATTAVLLRSFLTVHVVLGALFVAILNVANLFRYRAADWLLDSVLPWLTNATWLSRPVNLVPSIDPWFLAFEIIVFLGFLPLSIAYWLPSVARPESYERTRVVAFIICATTAFVMSLQARAVLAALGVLVTTLAAFMWVGAARRSVSLKSPAATAYPAGRAMVQKHLNKWLARATITGAIVLGIWVLDYLVFMFYPASMPLQGAVAAMCLTFAVLFGPLRWLALRLFTGAGTNGWKRQAWRVLTNPFLLPAASCALLLIQWDLVSHEMFRRGSDVGSGIVWTVVALLVTGILGGRSGIFLVNRSSLQPLFAARSSRTYLGASNPYRHVTEDGADVTTPQTEDDLPFGRYRPDRAGGPLHLINVVVNHSVERASGRRTHNRPGENMGVGPCGVCVGAMSQALWVTDLESGDGDARLIDVEELPAPLLPRGDSNEARPDAVHTDPMQLSDWVSISGAAMSPSQYSDTDLGTSLIYGLTNVRAGFWWDSGIEDGDRLGEPIPSIRARLGRWLMRRLRTQICLLAEFTGRFAGAFRRYWHLSDGGLADSLGLYELVRRRVPIIICADATRDVDGGVAALANAMRRVRVDFRADIQFLSATELHELAVKSGLGWTSSGEPLCVFDAIGTLEDLRAQLRDSPERRSDKHAALARVRYAGSELQSVLLYVKATVTGDEAPDVLEYQRQHPHFPHQSVLDQSLNEAQWESYRQLGHHCAGPLFREGVQWLADVGKAL